MKLQNVKVNLLTYRQQSDLTLVFSDLTSGAPKQRIPLAKITNAAGMQEGQDWRFSSREGRPWPYSMATRCIAGMPPP